MKKLNIAELLKDCPKGTKLYTTVWGDVEFIKVCDVGMITILPISDPYNTTNIKLLYFDGRFTLDGECVLFPSKENRDWNKFQRPFKDGDILAYNNGSAHSTIFIYRYDNPSWNTSYFVGLSGLKGKFYKNATGALDAYNPNVRFATKEEKQKLFKAIKDNGYKWNTETKALEKLIVPKFKVGDWIEFKYCERKPEKVIRIVNNVYWLSSGAIVMFQDENAYDLATKKFDISTLTPLESKVLVRNFGAWKPAFWGYYSKEYAHPFVVDGGNTFAQCIPYEDNKHLLGTTNDCDEYYKTWE